MSQLNQTREQHFRGHHRIRLGHAVPAIRAHKSRLHSDGHTEGQEEAYQEQGICLRLIRGPRGRFERYGGAPGAQVRLHDPQVGVGEAKGAKM